MGFNCGIIGLPNVGKSTVFNALTKAGAHMANYPFCTIDPNKAVVPVPDERLNKISGILNRKNFIPTRIEFIDVAGLVRGASKGEGLGNKFLGHIRNVDAVVHVVRCFRDENVVHVSGEIDPANDIEIIKLELILSDIEILERGLEKTRKNVKSGIKEAGKRIDVLQRLINHLNGGKFINSLALHEEEKHMVSEYGLITIKPFMYLANTGEGSLPEENLKKIRDIASADKSEFLTISGKLEEEISELPENEKKEYLDAMGLEGSALDRIIQAAYGLLGLITYYTAATELQAWTLEKGTTAANAAGKIHTDFERGFIRAEVYSFSDLVASGSEHILREKGHIRAEGKDYIVKDGDIIKFLFHV